MKRSVVALLASAVAIAGCQHMAKSGPGAASSGPTQVSALEGKSRSQVFNVVQYGTTLAVIERAMKKNKRDQVHFVYGLKSRFYIASPYYAGTGVVNKYYRMCFKNDKLVGKSKNECKFISKKLEIRQYGADELANMEEYHRNRSVPVKFDEMPSADGRKDGFAFQNIRMGAPLVQAYANCGVDRNYIEKEAKALSRACFVDLIRGESAEVYNLPVFGHEGSTVVETEGGRVTQIVYFSKRYDQKPFGRRVKDKMISLYGEPAFYDEVQVGDSRGRYHLKYIAYWRAGGNLVYLTNYGHLSERAMIIVVPWSRTAFLRG